MITSVAAVRNRQSTSLAAYQTPDHAPFHWRNGDHGVLLVHGFPGTPAEMRRVGAVFDSEGWSVHGLLLPGFGAEFADIGQKYYADWQAAVNSAVTELRRQYAAVLLAGNSFGGALALASAATQPVDGVILFAPFWRLDSWLDRVYPLAERVLPRIRPFSRANFDDPGFRTELTHFLSEVNLDDPAVRQQIRRLELPTRVIGQVRRAGQVGYAVADQVKAPVLIFQGHNDPLVRPHVTQQLAQRLPNLAGYIEIEGEHDLVRGRTSGWPVIDKTLRTFAEQVIHKIGKIAVQSA